MLFILRIQAGKSALRCAVRFIIGEAHIRIGNRRLTEQVIGDIRERLAVEPDDQGFDDLADIDVLIEIAARAIAVFPDAIDFVGFEAENEDILVADFARHFDVCAVERADGQSAVDHELHVARAARLFTGQRDLFGNFRCRHQFFRHCNVVFLGVYDVELFVDLGVLANIFGEEPDELDDLFGHVIARSRLCAENISFGLDLKIGIFFQGVIRRNDVEYVQKLTLILVHTLCLHVEKRLRVDLQTLFFGDKLSKLFLLDLFNFTEPLQYRLIVFKLLELGKLGGILCIARADAIVQELGKFGIGLIEPTSVRNAVGDVGEFIGRIFIEIAENALLDDLAVQARNAVDFVRPHHAEIGHLDDVMIENRHSADFIPIARIAIPELLAETAVDLFDNRMNTRQTARHEVFRPGFERFRQNGMVGVGTAGSRDLPSLFPGIAVLVDQDTHQFGHGKCGVRIVQMDGGELRQSVERAIATLMIGDDGLQ